MVPIIVSDHGSNNFRKLFRIGRDFIYGQTFVFCCREKELVAPRRTFAEANVVETGGVCYCVNESHVLTIPIKNWGDLK